uniref:Ovule protein n=1 Tax=Parascaris univalens TaxID=6257 RepID=A0A915ASW6_PARUN
MREHLLAPDLRTKKVTHRGFQCIRLSQVLTKKMARNGKTNPL